MISLRPLPSTIHGNEIFYLIVTWFQSGRIRPVSGTWGSLAALPFCWALKIIGGPWLMIAFAITIFTLGLWAIKEYTTHTKHADPAEVVIDEVLGMAIVWVFTPIDNLLLIITGFILFRLFDGIKRGPVGWCDKNIKGPPGVIIDDLVAGLMAGFCVWGLTAFAA